MVGSVRPREPKAMRALSPSFGHIIIFFWVSLRKCYFVLCYNNSGIVPLQFFIHPQKYLIFFSKNNISKYLFLVFSFFVFQRLLLHVEDSTTLHIVSLMLVLKGLQLGGSLTSMRVLL